MLALTTRTTALALVAALTCGSTLMGCAEGTGDDFEVSEQALSQDIELGPKAQQDSIHVTLTVSDALMEAYATQRAKAKRETPQAPAAYDTQYATPGAWWNDDDAIGDITGLAHFELIPAQIGISPRELEGLAMEIVPDDKGVDFGDSVAATGRIVTLDVLDACYELDGPCALGFTVVVRSEGALSAELDAAVHVSTELISDTWFGAISAFVD